MDSQPLDAPFRYASLPQGAAFLPLNVPPNTRVSRRGPARAVLTGPKLALVDADRLPDLTAKAWRTDPRGIVSRVFWHQPSGARPFTVRETLAARLLGLLLAPDRSVFYVNGDPLDLRVANLQRLQGREPQRLQDPGASFTHLLEYQEALKERIADERELSRQLPTKGRKAEFSAAVAKDILESVEFALRLQRDSHQSPLESGEFVRSYADIGEFIRINHGRSIGIATFSVPFTRKFLAGEIHRVDGFDYAKLKELLPRRQTSEQKLERLQEAFK